MTSFRSTVGRRAFLGLALAGLAACSTPNDERSYSDLSFTGQPPIRLNVATVNITQAYQPANADPHVDHLFPEPPVKAALQWAHDRLQAAGNDGKLDYTVTDASVIDTKLPRSTGLSSLTSIDQTDRFDLSLTVTAVAVSGDNLHRGSAQVTVTRSQTINEKTTAGERSDLWYEMTRQAMAELDTKLSGQINDNLAWFKQTAN